MSSWYRRRRRWRYVGRRFSARAVKARLGVPREAKGCLGLERCCGGSLFSRLIPCDGGVRARPWGVQRAVEALNGDSPS
jgi:hypothetical protein